MVRVFVTVTVRDHDSSVKGASGSCAEPTAKVCRAIQEEIGPRCPLALRPASLWLIKACFPTWLDWIETMEASSQRSSRCCSGWQQTTNRRGSAQETWNHTLLNAGPVRPSFRLDPLGKVHQEQKHRLSAIGHVSTNGVIARTCVRKRWDSGAVFLSSR